MTSRTALVSGVAVLALAAGAAGSVSGGAIASTRPAAGRTVNPASLPKGPAPKHAYLVGRRLYTPQGTSFTVPFPKGDTAYLTLLGRSPQGYIVEDDSGSVDAGSSSDTDVFALKVSGHHVTKHLVDEFTAEGNAAGATYRLSRDGTTLALIGSDGQGDGPYVKVVDMADKQLATDYYDYYGSILDLDATEIVTAGSNQSSGPRTNDLVHDTLYGSATTQVDAPGGAAADLAHEVLFTYADTGYDSGPTSLENPGTPTWTASDGDWRVSPDGDLVIGFSSAGLHVRRMSDGVILSTSKLDTPYDLVSWESDTAYLAVAKGPSGSAVVRCNARTGACRRTTQVTQAHLTMTRT